MRKLYYVPIIHSPEEAGSFKELLLEKEKEFRGAQLAVFLNEIDKFWQEVVRKIKNLNLDYSRLFIYQDSHPVETTIPEEFKQLVQQKLGAKLKAKSKEEIAQKLREVGVPFYKIIARLVEKGAILQGTENMELICREWQTIDELIELAKKEKEILKMNYSQRAKKQIQLDNKVLEIHERRAQILKNRDEFIAWRINETLPQNRVGVLFIGRLHQVDRELQKFPDIRVIYL